jgi:hypothetical protein
MPILCWDRRSGLQWGRAARSLNLLWYSVGSFRMHGRQLLASVIGAELSRWLMTLRTLDEVHGVRVEHAADGWHARYCRSLRHERGIIRNESIPPLLSDASWMLSASSHRPTFRRYQTVSGQGMESAASAGKKHQMTGAAYRVTIDGPSREAHK